MNVDKKKAPVCSGALVHQSMPFLPDSSRDGATWKTGYGCLSDKFGLESTKEGLESSQCAHRATAPTLRWTGVGRLGRADATARRAGPATLDTRSARLPAPPRCPGSRPESAAFCVAVAGGVVWCESGCLCALAPHGAGDCLPRKTTANQSLFSNAGKIPLNS